MGEETTARKEEASADSKGQVVPCQAGGGSSSLQKKRSRGMLSQRLKGPGLASDMARSGGGMREKTHVGQAVADLARVVAESPYIEEEDEEEA